MAEPGDDSRTPEVSGPGPGQTPRWAGIAPELEGYEITDRLGEGGMGTVWRATQLSTRREVALKLLGTAAFGSDKARTRFEREVELTARLQHPNIAQLFDSGLHHGMYYYVMELIPGAPLDKHVEEQHLTQRQVLELVRKVCEAVQHAHQRGVIHRDLKPSNILVTPDGQPHVLDFGLAKAFLEGDSGRTVSVDGEVAGTPAYMSPEQAAGHPDQMDTRSDVYSLGVILFRLLTRESPHDTSGTPYEVLRRIAEEEVKRPREIRKEVDRELEALLLKALAHDPEKRYRSAGDLAQDIQNYLNGDPLTAKPPTTAYFLRKRIAKYRGPVIATSSVLALLIGMAVFSYVRISRERTRAVAAEKLARDRLVETQHARDNARGEANKASAVKNFLQGMLASVHPGIAQGREITVREILDQAVSDIGTRLAEQPEVEAAVRATIGTTYLALGHHDAAEPQLSAALEVRRCVLGEQHRDTLASMHDLACQRMSSGRFAEAERLFKQTLEIQRRVLGQGDPDALICMMNLAAALSKQGKYSDGEEVMRQMVAIGEASLSHDSPLWRLMVFVRGQLLMGGVPEISETAGMVGQTLETRRLLADDEPLTVLSLRRVEAALRDLQAEEEASRRFEALIEKSREESELGERENLDRLRGLYGEEHPDTLRSMFFLALFLKLNGKLDEAEELFRRCAEARQRVLGAEDRDTMAAMFYLADTLEEEGKLDEAEATFRKGLEIQRRAPGADRQLALAFMKRRAALLEKRGKPDEEETIRKESLKIEKRASGDRDAASGGHVTPSDPASTSATESTRVPSVTGEK